MLEPLPTKMIIKVRVFRRWIAHWGASQKHLRLSWSFVVEVFLFVIYVQIRKFHQIKLTFVLRATLPHQYGCFSGSILMCELFVVTSKCTFPSVGALRWGSFCPEQFQPSFSLSLHMLAIQENFIYVGTSRKELVKVALSNFAQIAIQLFHEMRFWGKDHVK